MSLPALTRQVLDQMRCSDPGCDKGAHHGNPLVFKGRCHPTAGLRVSYQEGALTMECDSCRTLVVRVLVAADPSGLPVEGPPPAIH